MTDKKKRGLPEEVSRAQPGISLSISILGLAGIGISSYLTYIHFKTLEPVCLPGMDCNTVLTSPYAQIWGVPISLLGLVMYVFITAMGYLLLRVQNGWNDFIALMTYTLALSGTLYTAYLYYLELFKLHAFCPWCIASSIVIAGILVLSLINLFSPGRHLQETTHFMRIQLSRYIQW